MIEINGEKHFRWIWREFLKIGHPAVDFFKKPENQISIEPNLRNLSDPFQKFERNEPQRILENKLKNKLFERFQYIPISAPCGSGKTMMGLQMIHHLKLKTLIVSTRIAIKEQWEVTIRNIWKDVRVVQNSLKPGFDIYICSIQWLINNNNFPKDINFVILDEIHSMSNDGEFGKFLEIWKYFDHEIFICGLSATFPKELRTFGKPIVLPSPIVERKIFVKSLSGEPTVWNKGLSIPKFINQILKGIEGIPKIEECDRYHKFLCVTNFVAESVDCCRMIAKHFQRLEIEKDFVIVREATKGSFIVHSKDVGDDFCIDWILENCRKIKIREIDSSSAVGVFGCNARLKEGVNITSLTFGISTSFVWSVPFRIQLLGRIRRNEQDIKRFFITNSTAPPNNAIFRNGMMIKRPTKVTYDFDFQRLTYEKNGIVEI